MPLWLSLALLLMTALTALIPLAHASPPDPIWVGGVFDGTDFDDVVLAATSAEEANNGITFATVRALWLLVGICLFHLTRHVSSVLPALHSRPPPSDGVPGATLPRAIPAGHFSTFMRDDGGR